MDERQEQNLQEINASLESTIEWMRKRQPGDWARVQVPGEPHRYGTMHLYLLLRIAALLSEMNTRQVTEVQAQQEVREQEVQALQEYQALLQEYKTLLQEPKQEKRTSRRKPKEQTQ